MNDQLKNKLRLSMASTFMIIVTIVLIIVENKKNSVRFYSFIGLALSFALMAFTQIYNYKVDRKVKFIIFAFIYLAVSITLIVYLFTR